MMLRGDYIYFNPVTSAVQICVLLHRALTLNSVAKLLTRHLPLKSSCRESAADERRIRLRRAAVMQQQAQFFSEDIEGVNYV